MTRTTTLEDRVQKLETRFNFAVTLALFLGISVAGLGGWVRYEEGRVARLHDEVVVLRKQVDTIDPIVKEAKQEIERKSQEQLNLIRTQADPIVRELAQGNFREVTDQIKELQLDTFFIYYATIVYSGGRYHDQIDKRKNMLYASFNRTKEDLEGTLDKQGFPNK